MENILISLPAVSQTWTLRSSLAIATRLPSRLNAVAAERMVFAYNEDSIEHNCNVFTHTDYIRRCWGKWFDIVEIAPGAHHGFQTVVVLRKRARMRLAAAG